MDSTVVIKVRYGETLRRFTARVRENKLDMNMGGLREKVVSLLNFVPDADLTFAYVDEDGDVVTLVDEEDLHDAMRQSLDPLRITVKLNTEKGAKSCDRSRSTLMRSPFQYALENLESRWSSVAETLRSVPEPLHEVFSKSAFSLASKVAHSVTSLREVPRVVSEMELSEYGRSRGAAGSTRGASDCDGLEAIKDDIATTSEVHPDGKFEGPITCSNQDDSAPSDNSSVNVVPISSHVARGNKKVDEKTGGFHLNEKTVVGSTPASLTPLATAGKKIKEMKKSCASSIAGMSARVGASSNFENSRSRVGLGLFNICPFSGLPSRNDRIAAQVQFADHLNPFKRNPGPNDGAMGLIHPGVSCNVCGVNPISGPRFKSKVKGNFDLCGVCYAGSGNLADYSRIDRPRTVGHLSSLSNVLISCDSESIKLDSRFIRDVNVLDGSVMAPSNPFTKIWRMKNNGNVVWPQGTQLVWVGGYKFSDVVSVKVEIPLNGLPLDSELDTSVDFTAPELPGRYISYWRMASPSGQKFGQSVWVLIQVEASLGDLLSSSFRSLNLNLPPVSNGDNHLEPDSSNKATESVKAIVEERPHEDLESSFPISDALLVGNGASTPVPSEASSAVSFPIIALSEAAAATAPSQAPCSVATVNISAQGVGESDNDIEATLLGELEEMGFKEMQLNKEILRMNGYNLERSLDDLCGVAEQDLLEELSLRRWVSVIEE